MSLDRRDYQTAIPQLEKRIRELETKGGNVDLTAVYKELANLKNLVNSLSVSGGGISEDRVRAIVTSYNFITELIGDSRYELKGQGGGLDSNDVESKTTAEWLPIESTYIPKFGTIIVYADYITEGDINGNTTVHPAFKIGNGAQTLSQLPFVSSPVSKKLTHALTIGAYKYDGSEDVSVPVYDGDFSLD